MHTNLDLHWWEFFCISICACLGWTLLLNRNSNRLDKVDTENVNGSNALKKKGRSSDSCSFNQLMSWHFNLKKYQWIWLADMTCGMTRTLLVGQGCVVYLEITCGTTCHQWCRQDKFYWACTNMRYVQCDHLRDERGINLTWWKRRDSLITCDRVTCLPG